MRLPQRLTAAVTQLERAWKMSEFFKVIMSDGVGFMIEIKAGGVADYRANLLDAAVRPTDEVDEVLARLTDLDWLTFKASSTQIGALCNVLAFLNEQRSFGRYIAEVLPIKEPTRVELCNHWYSALDLAIKLQDDVALAQSHALQSAQYADEYKRELRKVKEELCVAARIAVELHDEKDIIAAYVTDHVKAEA